MKNKLTRILIWFAITIGIVLASGGIFKLGSDRFFSEEQQQRVFIQAIPFIAVFVSIVLGFVCLIVLVAVAYNGKVPTRTYRPVEWIIVAGILIGVAGLFQGWKRFAYEYGFPLLLVSVLAFMVWSHLTPMPPRLSKQLPPLSRKAQRYGLLVAFAVWLVIGATTSLSARPVAPYGISKQIWETMMDEAERAAATDNAQTDYRTGRVPYLLFVSLLPGAIAYLLTRELVESALKPTATGQPPANAAAGNQAQPG